ncbi:MAG: hypothetical protein AAF456_03845 [Planctomycetota bacterium]
MTAALVFFLVAISVFAFLLFEADSVVSVVLFDCDLSTVLDLPLAGLPVTAFADAADFTSAADLTSAAGLPAAADLPADTGFAETLAESAEEAAGLAGGDFVGTDFAEADFAEAGFAAGVAAVFFATDFSAAFAAAEVPAADEAGFDFGFVVVVTMPNAPCKRVSKAKARKDAAYDTTVN